MFLSKTGVFEMQGYWKSEINRMTPELPETFNFTGILYTLMTLGT